MPSEETRGAAAASTGAAARVTGGAARVTGGAAPAASAQAPADMQAPVAGVARRRWSIRRRVLVGTALATTVAMVLVGLVGLVTVRTLLNQSADDQLATATTVLTARLAEVDGVVKQDAIARILPSTMMVVGVADEQVVVAIAGSREDVGSGHALVAATPAARGGTAGPVWTGTVDGHRMRASAVSTPGLVFDLAPDGQRIAIDRMVIAVDVSADVSVVRTMLRVELVALAILLVLVIMTVRWIVICGMSPLRELASQASAVADGTRDGITTDLPNDESATLALALDDALRRRTRAEVRLRAFVADASHELRTPLTVVHGWADLYLNGGIASDGVEDAMVRIEAESTRMRRRVERMAALAVGDELTPVHQTRVDVSTVVAAVVDDFAVVAPDRRIDHGGLAGGVVVIGDRDAIAQVVHNLIGNAVRHTGRACTVTVGLGVRAANAGPVGGDDGSDDGGQAPRSWPTNTSATRPVEPPAHAPVPWHDWAVLTVADDGAGIAPEVLDRVFERTVRGRSSGGSGLGLAVVRSIVESHRGQISITTGSTGTTITVLLPLAGQTA